MMTSPDTIGLLKALPVVSALVKFTVRVFCRAGKDFKIVRLNKRDRVPIPLPLTVSRIWVRPAGWSVDFCNKPIYWHHILKSGEVSDCIRTCDTIFGDPASYRYDQRRNGHVINGDLQQGKQHATCTCIIQLFFK